MSTQTGAAAGAPSLYFSFGVTKTGSTLAYRMTRHFLECRGHSQALLPDHLQVVRKDLNSWSQANHELLEEIAEWVSARGIFLALKTHRAPTKSVRVMLREGRAMGHATFRDPREIALSLVDHGRESQQRGLDPIRFRDLNDATDSLDLIERQLAVFNRWENLPLIETWYYDDFAFNPDLTFDKLAHQTGLKPLSSAERASFDGTAGTKFNKAVQHRWKSELTDEESAEFKIQFSDFYKQLWLRRLSWRSRPLAKAARKVFG